MAVNCFKYVNKSRRRELIEYLKFLNKVKYYMSLLLFGFMLFLMEINCAGKSHKRSHKLENKVLKKIAKAKHMFRLLGHITEILNIRTAIKSTSGNLSEDPWEGILWANIGESSPY